MTTRTFRGLTYTVKTETGNGKTLQGSPGNDWIEVLGSNNRISTGSGNDVILVGVEFGIIDDYPPYAGSAIFYTPLSGSAQPFGTTTINTGAGDDYVAVGNGDPFMDSGKAANYVIDLGRGNNIFDGGGTRGPSTIRVSAGNGDDIIDVGGFGGDYTVNAGGGDNLIYLASGNASVWAGSGNDVVTIKRGTPNSPGGIDVVDAYLNLLGGQPYKQSIDAGNGDNQIGLTVFGKTEIRTGSGQDFVLAASAATRFLNAPINTDQVTILTGAGNDTVITIDTKSLIKTGSGDDFVFSGMGDDTIYAGSGNNVINLRGATIPIPEPLAFVGVFGASRAIVGGGNDTVYLDHGDDKSKKGHYKFGKGHDTVILGSGGFATIHGFGCNDRLDVMGLNASFTRSGGNTLISSGGNSIGILQGYTGPIGLV
jgi:Ca2+-binding RTX toxin-like protein